MSKSPKAAWYSDPEDGTQLRYWDGQQWTEHRAAVDQDRLSRNLNALVQGQRAETPSLLARGLTTEQKIERNSRWYADHPKTTKFLKGAAVVTALLFVIGLLGDNDEGSLPVADESPAVLASEEPKDDTASEEQMSESEEAVEEAAAKAAEKVTAAKAAAKQARIEARREADRQARVEARKEAARQRRIQERKARQAAAAEARREAAATEVYYANCTEVEQAGAAPIYRGQPGYSTDLDRDGDGSACDQ
jgi:hypothetical protein